MRKDLLALGCFVMVLGLALNLISQTSTREQDPYDRWDNLNYIEANPPVGALSVDANLTSGGKYRLWFSLHPSEDPYFPNGLGVKMNLTDPYGNVSSYLVRIDISEGKIETLDPYPVVVANHSGLYRYDGRSLGAVSIRLLVIQESVHVEPPFEYPFRDFYLVSIVLSFVGFGIFLVGLKLSKRKKLPRKKRYYQRKGRVQRGSIMFEMANMVVQTIVARVLCSIFVLLSLPRKLQLARPQNIQSG